MRWDTKPDNRIRRTSRIQTDARYVSYYVPTVTPTDVGTPIVRCEPR
jgi:hypothetical protein